MEDDLHGVRVAGLQVKKRLRHGGRTAGQHVAREPAQPALVAVHQRVARQKQQVAQQVGKQESPYPQGFPAAFQQAASLPCIAPARHRHGARGSVALYHAAVRANGIKKRYGTLRIVITLTNGNQV
jgi:hypothetical protein